MTEQESSSLALRLLLAGSLLLSLPAGSGAAAQEKPSGVPARPVGPPSGGARPPAEAEQDARQIRATIEGLHRALEKFFQDRRIDPVMNYYDNLAEYFSPSGEREGPKEIRRRLQSHAPRVSNFRTQVSPMTIRVSGDLGWAACEVHESYTFDGQSGEEDLICTYVLERRPQGWRIVHEHQSLKLAGDEPAPGPP